MDRPFLRHRRVVTGLNEEGRSCAIIDGPVPDFETGNALYVWRTDTLPADNTGQADTAVPYELAHLHSGGSSFAVCAFEPGEQHFMRAVDTIDYFVILKGRVTLMLETGEVTVGPGDFLVNRGVLHAWRNPFDEPCIFAVVHLPAEPIGAGRTI